MTETKAAFSEKRVTYADAARVLASAFVVLLHAAGQFLTQIAPGDKGFLWCLFYDCLARWTVPMFIMLSGMLFLNKGKKLDIKKLWRKNILRIVTAFIFWSYIYNVYKLFLETRSISAFFKAVPRIPDGAMHLWFLYVIAGLYIVLPFLKKMTENMTKRETEYFLLINLSVTFLPKTLRCFELLSPLAEQIDKFEIGTAAGYVGLFVAGWYIENFEHEKFFVPLSAIFGTAGFLYMYIMSASASFNEGVLVDKFMSFKSLSAYAMAFAAFVLFKNVPFRRGVGARAGALTFGVYLVHQLVLNLSNVLGLSLLRNMPCFGVPILAALAFAVSMAAAWAISKLPFGKYIV